MTRLLKIIFLFVVAVLFIGYSNTAKASVLNHESDFRVGKTQHQSTIIPVNNPELYGINRLGKSAVDLLRIPPVPNTKKDSEETSRSGILSETPIRRAVSIYLNYSKDLNQSLTIRELLFPFHHFL